MCGYSQHASCIHSGKLFSCWCEAVRVCGHSLEDFIPCDLNFDDEMLRELSGPILRVLDATPCTA